MIKAGQHSKFKQLLSSEVQNQTQKSSSLVRNFINQASFPNSHNHTKSIQMLSKATTLGDQNTSLTKTSVGVFGPQSNLQNYAAPGLSQHANPYVQKRKLVSNTHLSRHEERESKTQLKNYEKDLLSSERVQARESQRALFVSPKSQIRPKKPSGLTAEKPQHNLNQSIQQKIEAATKNNYYKRSMNTSQTRNGGKYSEERSKKSPRDFKSQSLLTDRSNQDSRHKKKEKLSVLISEMKHAGTSEKQAMKSSRSHRNQKPEKTQTAEKPKGKYANKYLLFHEYTLSCDPKDGGKPTLTKKTSEKELEDHEPRRTGTELRVKKAESLKTTPSNEINKFEPAMRTEPLSGSSCPEKPAQHSLQSQRKEAKYMEISFTNDNTSGPDFDVHVGLQEEDGPAGAGLDHLVTSSKKKRIGQKERKNRK